jgi:hypothetical protein
MVCALVPQGVCPFPSYTQTRKTKIKLGQEKNEVHVFLKVQ